MELALSDWEKTHSPMAHWSKVISRHNTREPSNFDLSTTATGSTRLAYGLPAESDAIQMCRHRYRYELAKLTVQIVSPDVMKIRKDVKMSFFDQLGVIGNIPR